ncbi:MAG: MFS transporter [Xenococcaceae cyanobacterium]
MKPVNTFKTLEPDKLQNLLILFTAGLLFWTSLTSMLPTLPAYIQDVGGTTQQVGLVMGCFAIGLLLSRTWLGQLADKRSRKLVVLIGTVVAGIAPIGYLLAQSIHVLMALRAFHGISIAAFTTGYSALVVDLSPVKQRGELIGYMSLAVPTGMAVGPALGGFLQASVSYTPLFLVSASSGFLAFVLASQVREASRQETLHDQKDSQSKPNRSFWQLVRSPSLLVPAVILLLIGLLFGALLAFLPLFIRQLEVDFNAGLFYTAAAIASFSVRIFAGKASDRYGRGLFITGSLVCYGLSMLLLVFAQTPTAFIAAAVAEGAGGGILIPMMLALISDRSYAAERGQVYALCISGFDVGIALAGPVLGSLAVIFGYRGMFSLTACLALLALLVFLTQSNKNLTHSLRFAIGQEKDVYALD